MSHRRLLTLTACYYNVTPPAVDPHGLLLLCHTAGLFQVRPVTVMSHHRPLPGAACYCNVTPPASYRCGLLL
eukprot:3670786-Pyramimonas_sp.AAC.1